MIASLCKILKPYVRAARRQGAIALMLVSIIGNDPAACDWLSLSHHDDDTNYAITVGGEPIVKAISETSEKFDPCAPVRAARVPVDTTRKIKCGCDHTAPQDGFDDYLISYGPEKRRGVAMVPAMAAATPDLAAIRHIYKVIEKYLVYDNSDDNPFGASFVYVLPAPSSLEYESPRNFASIRALSVRETILAYVHWLTILIPLRP